MRLWGLVAVTWATVLPAAAHASAWLAPETPSGATGRNLAAGMSPDGRPVIAWTTASATNEIDVAVRAPGGSYTTQVVANAPATSYTVDSVAIDDAGDLAVTWSNGTQVFMATEAAGAGSFTERSGPGGPAFGTGASLSARILPDGTVVAAGALGGAPETFTGAVGGDGTFSETTLSTSGDTLSGPVALVADGAEAAVTFVALHADGGGEYHNRVYLSRFASGGFGTPVQVDSGADLLQGTAAIDADVDDASIDAGGDVDIVSVGSYGNTSGQGHSYLRATYAPASGPPTVSPLDTVNVATGYEEEQITTATVSEQGPGGAAALWSTQPDIATAPTTSGAVRASGATTYGSASTVTSAIGVLGSAPTPEGATALVVGASPVGLGQFEVDSVAVSAAGFDAPATRLSLAASPNPIPFGVTGPARMPSGSGSSTFALYSTPFAPVPILLTFDGTPPVLGLTVPATGVTGQPVAIAASVTDQIDSAATGTLNFGDGASGPASTAAHTYASPGTYTVTLTATDASGNESVPVRQQITIRTPSSSGGCCTGTGPGTGPGKGLTITQLKLHPSTVSGRKRRTTLSFTVSAAATVHAVLKRRVCRRHKCTTKSVRTYSKRVRKPGHGSLVISVPRALPAGRYPVTVMARSGKESTHPRTLHLRVRVRVRS